MDIDQLKATPEWKAATKQKRHAFLSTVSAQKRAEKGLAGMEKPSKDAEPKTKPQTHSGKYDQRGTDGSRLAELARDILRCSGLPHVTGVGLFQSADWRVRELVGGNCVGKTKDIMRTHHDALRCWCQQNWVPKKKKAGVGAQHPQVIKRGPMASAGAPPMRAPITTPIAGINVQTDDFLRTFEWRRVRMEALKKYGPVCQCCGATPATGAVMNVDHIKPRKLFPQLALDVSNLQILCHECNHGKGNWDMTDWRQKSETSTRA